MRNRKVTLPIVTIVAASSLTLLGCSRQANTGGAQEQGQKQTETAFKQQSTAVPYPVRELTDSLERRNVRERLLRTNKPNAISYVYLLSMTGQYVGYYVIKGKVSSTQSQMTTSQLITWACPNNIASCAWDRMQSNVINAPGDDGSYGDNESGVFFFTSDGTMVTTSMEYVQSDQPLPVEAPRLHK
jgi:hypothetical protein